MGDARPVEVTAAEIAESLGVPLDGSLHCKGQRHVAVDDPRDHLPRMTFLEPDPVSSFLYAALAALFLAATVSRAVAGEEVSFFALLALVLAFCSWMTRPRAVRPMAEVVPYAQRVIATPTELQMKWADEWESYSWSALRRVELRDGGFRLQVGPRDVQLRKNRSTRKLVHAAEMVLARRRAAGHAGLRFVDEAGDAALSVTRLTGDEAAERGLSVSEGEGHE